MNRTAAYTGRCRELFEKAAREGIELPDVARGYLMLRGARLGPERKAIVLAAAGQSFTERNVAQALRSTFPINLGVTKEFVHVMDDCDEPLMPLEEQSVSEVDSGEIDALITNFETLSNTTEESCPIDEEEAARTLVTWKESRQNLNMVKRDRNFSQRFQFSDASARHRADSPKDEMLPLSSHWTLQQRLPRTSPEETSVPGEGVGDERGPLCKASDKDTGRAPFGD